MTKGIPLLHIFQEADSGAFLFISVVGGANFLAASVIMNARIWIPSIAINAGVQYGEINAKGVVTDSHVLLYPTLALLVACGFELAVFIRLKCEICSSDCIHKQCVYERDSASKINTYAIFFHIGRVLT